MKNLLLTSPFRSLRHFLAALVLVVVLPGLLFGLMLAWWSAHQLVEGRGKEADRLATTAAERMASHVKSMTAFTVVLSRLPLDEAHYESFYRLAKGFASNVGYHITLADGRGNQFVSSRLPFGVSLPKREYMETIGKAVASGRPEVSNLFMGKMARQYVVSVDTPVGVGEGLRIITLSCDAALIATVLMQTVVPEGWILGLIDGKGNIIARNKDQDKWVGKPVRQELIEAAARSEVGTIHKKSLEGIQLFSVYRRVPGTSWTVIVGIPENLLYAPLAWPLGLLGGATALVIGLTALLGFLFTRELNNAATRLIKVAHEPLQEAGDASAPNSFIEFEEVAQVLRSVAAKRQELMTALDLSVSIIRDTDGTIRHWTTGCEQLYGWTRAEALGRLSHELLNTAFPEPHARIEAKLWRDGEWRGEVAHTRRDGLVARISAHWKLHTMADGEPPVVVETLQDISAETRLEAALREGEAHFRATFEQAGVGVCHADAQGRFLRVNDKYCAIVGYEREELLRLKFQDITHPEDVRPNVEGRAQLLAGRIKSYSMEKRYIRKDGSVVWIELSIALVRTVGGDPDYFLAVAQDIQHRKEVEAALAQEREANQAVLEKQVVERTAQLQAANRQLEGFLYAASHDLKGPLGRISSFSTLLEKNYRERLEGDGLLFIDFIRENAVRLNKLIDDLLSHARIDQAVSGLQATDLLNRVQVALQEKAEDIRETGTVVRLDLPPTRVLAEPYALSQVLNNLLENALKYSAQDRMPVLEIGGEEVEGNFRLWVRDNGIGFDMEYHDKIFEIFRRLHTYAEYTGSGVGLALVKRAMERMGGRVWAESEPGQGATFYLQFQLAGATAERPVAA